MKYFSWVAVNHYNQWIEADVKIRAGIKETIAKQKQNIFYKLM